MRIINEALLAEFRCVYRCEWCHRPNRDGLDPHHIWKRGMGGGSRLDIRVNLIALCRFPCHRDADEGRITRDDLLAIVARREKVTPEEIAATVYRLRRTPKGART